MNKEQLQELLHEEYKTENWKKIAEFVFPNVQFLQKPFDIPSNNDKVKAFRQLGNVKLNDGKNLAMFEVTVAENVNIAHNRVALRNLVKDYIDQERNHGVLVIYEQGKDDYRFTFTAKSTEFDNDSLDFVNRETNAKRFTYVLGKNESCKTPAERFFTLAQNKSNADIKAVEDAFSVEKLSKQFFKEYKEHYLRFVNYILGNNSYRIAIFKENEKEVRDFVKLLLGRLVFIQFVQKKKWMGVPANVETWQQGDPKFLYNSFKNFANKDLFYSHFLEPLFYDALSKSNRKNNIFTVTGTKIPFLNGGLFEKTNTDTSLLGFPKEYFEDLFEFFDRFNFTINEYDPIEHEIGIDPEMLGSIFENLLEDNKDKGAFYTPKEIVHYMCQESLKEYLKTYLQENNRWPENDELEPALDAFVKRKDAADIIELDEPLALALRDVKICDPAIGSGAFPMGLLNEIYQCVYVLHAASPDVVGNVWNMGDVWQPDVVKKNIIQNSIYGVDIEKGAVDIARLRFWLSLIIDEPEPHALPNLDYKIVVGNSLISKFNNILIDIDWSLNSYANNLFSADLAAEKSNLLRSLSEKQKQFFDSSCDKTNLAAEIRNVKIDLIINQLQLMIVKQNVQLKPNPEHFKNKGKAQFVKETERYLQSENWRNTINDLKLLKSQLNNPLEFFDWKLDFPEIMNENVAKKVGFDIVIGNPPYVNIANLKDDVYRNYLKSKFKVTKNKTDLYAYFLEKGKDLLKENGTLTFIIPNSWLGTDSFSLLRKMFIEETKINSIVKCPSDVFDATVTTVIISFLNKIVKKNEFKLLELKNKEFITYGKTTYDIIKNKVSLGFSFKQEIKINKYDDKLGDIAKFSLGIKTSDDNKFILNIKNDQDCFPLLRGKDINRYYSTYKDKWIWYKPDLMMKKTGAGPRKREIFTAPKKILIKDVATEIQATIDKELYFTNDTISLIYSLEGYSFEYVTAILNSKLINKWFKNNFEAGLHIKINQLSHIPLVKVNNILNKQISSIVNSIIAGKSQGIDTFDIEQQIDNIVYRIYELSYEEISQIDPNFSLSKEEYENIKID